MPTPKKGQTQKEFVQECIPVLIKEGKEADQATAICYSMWKESKAEEISKDVFDNPEEALKRAKELGLDDIHSHQSKNGKVYMPAKNHNEYTKALEESEALQYGKPSKNDPRKTPAPKKDRRKGSDKNPKKSAEKANPKIEFSKKTEDQLKSLVKKHNEKGKGSKATLGMLKAVYRRGAGAYSTSHAPKMSRHGWAIARVNAFLYLLRNGRPSNPNYKQDNDLLPKGHKRSSKSKASFSGKIKVVDFDELEHLGISKASFMSQAKSLIPTSFDPEKNIDILPIVFNLAVINRFNENGDGIDTKSAAKVLKQFINKPINIEHKKNLIVGHIINASFSDKEPDFVENDIVDYLDRKDPFYITVAGLIYKHVYPDLADALIEASDPNSETYQEFSSSWEIAFDDYEIAVGSKNLEECQVYNEESDEYDLFNDYLKSMGGSGISYAGNPVSRLLSGNIYPIGCAITTNPAAEVEGIYVSDSFEEDEEEGDYINKSSQFDKNDVNHNDTIDHLNMSEEQFEELKELLKSIASAKDLDESKASAFDEIKNTLQEAGEEWKSQAEKAKDDLENAQKEIETLQSNFTEASSELEKMKEELAMREAVSMYNDRMKSISAEFDLNEAEEEVIASEVKAIGMDSEDFEKYMAKLKVLMSSKLRENLSKEHYGEKSMASEDVKEEAVEIKKETETSKASDENETEIEIEISESSDLCVTNNNGQVSEEETLIERLKKTGLTLA